ncbi:unnamed protein product [Camellia sinensis]
MWATHCNSFLHIPCNLLVSCIKHPDLTVDSEWHLADAFIVWLAANTEQFESSSSTRDDCNGILKEIRISLLPLWFAAGKRRCCYFSKFANQSIEAILNLTAHSSTSMMNVLGDIGSHHLKIRLTQYTKKLGCTSVTDAGISILVLRCIKLHSLVVCDTSFGQNSILALTSGIPNLNRFPTQQIDDNNAKSLAFKLQVLHMGGCNGVDETSLSKLMSETTMLKSLCLRETQIIDSTLYSFLGSFLEMLDVSDTKVSSAALAHIISRNPGLKCLKAKGCRNLFHQKSKTEGGVFSSFKYSCREWYIELGETCKLEEIALGWGFSCFSLEALKPAITTLRAITVGLGASLGQDSIELLPTTCPLLETVILYFQVISDCVLINIMESLRHLQVLALCHCLGDISPVSFKYSVPNLRKLKLERVTPWMTNDDLVILTQNCANLIELSLLGCRLLNSEFATDHFKWLARHDFYSSRGDCGEVTRNGVASLFDCKAVEDIMLRHNGTGIQKNVILDAASMMPMLRKVSLDVCDASEGDFEIPNWYFLSIVKIARCKLQRCGLDLQKFCRTPVHKETLVLVWDSKNLTRTVIKERV